MGSDYVCNDPGLLSCIVIGCWVITGRVGQRVGAFVSVSGHGGITVEDVEVVYMMFSHSA